VNTNPCCFILIFEVLKTVNVHVVIWAVASCSLAGLKRCHILEMGAEGVFETLVTISQATRRHIPQLRSVNSHSCWAVRYQNSIGKLNAIDNLTELEVKGRVMFKLMLNKYSEKWKRIHLVMDRDE
jgi:hypothetical protein